MSISDPLYDPSDRLVDDYYCEHDRFIGNPHGADYMCGFCESGISREDYLRYCMGAGNRSRRKTTVEKFLAEVWKVTGNDLHGWKAVPEGVKELFISITVAMWKGAQ